MAGCRPHRELKWWVEVDVFTGPSDCIFLNGSQEKGPIGPENWAQNQVESKKTGQVWPHQRSVNLESNLRSANFSQKQTHEFVLFAFLLFMANKSNSSVRFLGEFMARQSAFWFYLTFRPKILMISLFVYRNLA